MITDIRSHETFSIFNQAKTLTYSILLSIMCIELLCAPAFHNDFWKKNIFLFFKNNSTIINHCIFIHHKSNFKPLLNYLPCIVCREYFSIIFNVKKCALCSIKYRKCLCYTPSFNRPLCLSTLACQFGILKIFINNFCFNIHCT